MGKINENQPVLKFIYKSNVPTWNSRRGQPGGRSEPGTSRGIWRAPAGCTASCKNQGNPYSIPNTGTVTTSSNLLLDFKICKTTPILKLNDIFLQCSVHIYIVFMSPSSRDLFMEWYTHARHFSDDSQVVLNQTYNTYRLCWWMRTNSPFKASRLMAPPIKNEA